jgi:hypothetical protein
MYLYTYIPYWTSVTGGGGGVEMLADRGKKFEREKIKVGKLERKRKKKDKWKILDERVTC